MKSKLRFKLFTFFINFNFFTFFIICSSQTDHDFNLEKQNLVHNGKLKVQEEYTQKEKNLEVEQRV
jgi:hypothetical protein